MRGVSMIQKLMNEVELVARHLEVIRAVLDNQPIGILKLSEILGIPSHRVRYSLKVLEHSGYIKASPAGAVATEKAAELIGSLNEDLDSLIRLIESVKTRQDEADRNCKKEQGKQG